MKPIIQELASIQDIHEFMTDGTLVFFDVDNTLIDTYQEFGCDGWIRYIMGQLVAKGNTQAEALKKSFALYKTTNQLMRFKPVEDKTIPVLETLRKKNIPFYSLTMRALYMAHDTQYHLRSAQIPYSEQNTHPRSIKFSAQSGYENGIVYAGTTGKGTCLDLFLEKTQLKPQHILFVDDAQRHVNDVAQLLAEKEIPHHCLRYGATDAREQRFDLNKAKDELKKTLGHDRYEQLFKDIF